MLAIELVDLARELIEAAAADDGVARLRGTVVGAMPHLLDGLGLLSSFPLEWSRQLLPHLHKLSLVCSPTFGSAVNMPPKAPSTTGAAAAASPPPTEELRVLSRRPLAADARAETLTVAIEGASHLSVSFDALCELTRTIS